MMNAQRSPSRNASGRAEAAWGSRPTDQLDDWLAIESDGTVTAYSGKVELGTGTLTALAQIVAEELDVAMDRVHMVMGDTTRTPNEGYTAGSMTIQSSGSVLRQAAAEAHRFLLEMAAAKLDTPKSELVVNDGTVSVREHAERNITYAALMGGKLFKRTVPQQGAVKHADLYRVVGTSNPRVDLPLKVTGQPAFIQDLRVPGMLHGRVARPPSEQAKFISMKEDSVRDVPDLVRVFHQGNYVGVITEREEQTILAAQLFNVQWDEKPTLPRMADLYQHLRALPTLEQPLTESVDLETAFNHSVQQFHAEYFQPYQAHASIGPSCAVADVKPDEVTVWSSTSGPHPLRDKVHLIHVEGAGSHGQNGSDDVAADAVILSQAVGKPVRVQWSREEEFIWEPKAPAMVMEIRAGIDAAGDIVAWDYHAWSPTHVARPSGMFDK
jgi:nicotinate dehydrogenase subunit B